MNKLDDKVGFNAWFGKAAARAAGWVGSPWAFILALACVLVWGSLAPLTCFLSPQLQRSQWRTRPLYSQVVPGYQFLHSWDLKNSLVAKDTGLTLWLGPGGAHHERNGSRIRKPTP
jgi:hypothetical protein